MRCRRFSGLLALLLVFATTPARVSEPTAHTYSLPQIADGQFMGGSIRTTFVFFNNGRGTSSVRLSLRDDDGGPLTATIPELGTAADFEFTLGQGEVRFLRTDANQPVTAGSAEVLSDLPIGVSAIFSVSDPQGNFLTQSGIAVSPESVSLKLAVDVGESLNTGVAIRNPDLQNPVHLVLTLRDSEGVRRGPPSDVTIPPGGHTAQFVSGDLFPSLGVFQGSLELESDGPVSALALRQHSSPLSFTTLPVAPGDSPRLEFAMPQIANASLARTTFVLFNLDSTDEASVAIRLTGDDGEPFAVRLQNGQEGSEFSIRIPAAGTRFLATTGMGDTGAGAARITSDKPLGVAGIVTLLGESGNFVSETGVEAPPEVTRATIPVAGGIAQTGLALFNANPEPAVVSVRFNEGAATDSVSDGVNFLASGPVDLAPFGHLAVFVPQFGLDVEGRAGSLAVSSTRPVSVQTLLQTSDPLAFTTLPAAEGLAPTLPPSALVLARQSEGVDLTADLVLDQELPGGFELSGGVLSFGPFDQLVGITAVRQNDGRFFSGLVANGPARYRMVLPAGVYSLRVHLFFGENFIFAAGFDSTLSAELSKALRTGPAARFGIPPSVGAVFAVAEVATVAVEGDSLLNLRVPQIPRRVVTGRVSGLEGVSQEPREMPLSLLLFPTDSEGTPGFAEIDEDGSFRVELAEGRYMALLLLVETDDSRVPRLVYLANLPLGEFSVGATGAAPQLSVPELVQVSGIVSSPYSAEIPRGSSVFGTAQQAATGVYATSQATVFSDGSYRLRVVRDQGYRFSVSMPLESPPGSFSSPSVVSAEPPVETFSQDSVRNFSSFPPLPPAVTLSGRVVGPSGPLPEALVAAISRGVSGAPESNFTAFARTDSEGRYTLQVLSGDNYLVTFSGQ